jgi:hypothetical protein
MRLTLEKERQLLKHKSVMTWRLNLALISYMLITFEITLLFKQKMKINRANGRRTFQRNQSLKRNSGLAVSLGEVFKTDFFSNLQVHN